MISFLGFSQKMNLQKFSVKEGLAQSTVKQIVEDDYGNLWLATNNGLSKFNGYGFENYTTTNGLPSNEITSLFYTKDLLCIGTRKGFCTFDGSKFTATNTHKKIRGATKKILQKKDILHVFTSAGYYLIDLSAQPFKVDSIPVSNIIDQNITDAEFDDDGNIWISTIKNGIYFIEINTSTKISKVALVQCSKSSTVFGKKLVRVAKFDSNNFLKGNQIISIEFDKKQNLLVSDWENGISKIAFNYSNSVGIEVEEVILDTVVSGKSSLITRVVSMNGDKEGNMYFSSDGFGLYKVPVDVNTGENNYGSYRDIVHYGYEDGMYGNHPLTIIEDKNKNLWLGTLYDGLILMNNKSSLSFNKSSGLTEEKVISLIETKDSSIWIGTYGGGAIKFKDKKFKQAFWDQGISESIIKTIIEDDYNNIWLGTTGGGISIISKENTQTSLNVSKIISQLNNLSSNFLSYLYKASNGDIWVGYQGDNKLDRIQYTSNLTYTITTYPITSLSKFTVSCITEDDSHNIWISSNEGVWVLDPNTKNINNDYASFKNIQTLFKDWNGNMWLGSYDVGLIILKNKFKARYTENANANLFEKYTSTNGLSSNCVNSILFLKESAWIITNNGINEVIIDKYLNRIKEIKSYNKGNGFASYDNKPNTALFDEFKTMWIGSVEGLTKYENLSENKTNEPAKKITTFIDGVSINNKSINWGDSKGFLSGELSSIKFDGLLNWNRIPKNLVLDYEHNSIEFFLNTDDISDQKTINYQYKLIGFDKNWNTIFSSNTVNYKNLPSGDYSLVIKASISNDFTSAEEITFQFSIKPPFWKSTWFYVLVGLGLAGMLYYFVSSREARLKREKMKLELEVKARTYEIEKKKKEIEVQSTLINGINKDMTDSIVYAQRIQKTILPSRSVLKKYFADFLVLYKPKNIVSGDYYWIKETNNLIYVAAVDCTGHGVPGAFMSLISSSILNEAVNLYGHLSNPVKIVEYLRQEISARLTQNNKESVYDGLDIALICYDKEQQTVEFVNANRPMYVITNNELITLTSENVNIAGFAEVNSVIPTKTYHVKKNDLLFIFTDGITDQFGGPRNKKFNTSKLRQFLLMNDEMPLIEMREKLNTEITNWQGSYEQTDDILFIGLKI